MELPGKGFVSVGNEKDFNRFYRTAKKIRVRTSDPVNFTVHRAFWKALLIDSSYGKLR